MFPCLASHLCHEYIGHAIVVTIGMHVLSLLLKVLPMLVAHLVIVMY